jgi:hypothetical protein
MLTITRGYSTTSPLQRQLWAENSMEKRWTGKTLNGSRSPLKTLSEGTNQHRGCNVFSGSFVYSEAVDV